jgi:hypothetical protein
VLLTGSTFLDTLTFATRWHPSTSRGSLASVPSSIIVHLPSSIQSSSLLFSILATAFGITFFHTNIICLASPIWNNHVVIYPFLTRGCISLQKTNFKHRLETSGQKNFIHALYFRASEIRVGIMPTIPTCRFIKTRRNKYTRYSGVAILTNGISLNLPLI